MKLYEIASNQKIDLTSGNTEDLTIRALKNISLGGVPGFGTRIAAAKTFAEVKHITDTIFNYTDKQLLDLKNIWDSGELKSN